MPADRTLDLAASPLLDPDVYRDLWALLGAEQMDRLLVRLERQLATAFAQDDAAVANRSDLAREAHSLVSQAGMLGFLEFAETCRELEAVCLGEDDAARWLDEARLARDRAVKEIGRLRGASKSVT